ncbi:MAG: GMC family oxidoreductase [Pseudomonadota bacterium]|nr:GMC family oxidoreductase [Pseudomonadota bacterium]MDP1905896.1 GMC family oxidoreductase [Pseudomonadota bacterium]MDP2351768.1 GMC family oxidoreductase [Pseudomonadota bacterium]
MTDFDAVIIGSGAGGGAVAWRLAMAGKRVLVLEKGPWFTEADYFKDELACCRRSVYTPDLRDERHVIEERDGDGWDATSTTDSGWDFWNGNVVGGSSNFMSGFFHRLKPVDFRLRSEFGPIKGANVVDWPIAYEDLEPYFTEVESAVGVSGRVVKHPFLEPRSTPDFPYPPTAEHPVSAWIDTACDKLGYRSLPLPRAILSQPRGKRRSCEYSGYCGSYGCSSGAKGSSRAALLDDAVATGRCEVRPHSQVFRLLSDAQGRVKAVEYFDRAGKKQRVSGKVYVVACQAIETSRLLLASTGSRHPNGLGNRHSQVGRNLIFSAGGVSHGRLVFDELGTQRGAEARVVGPFLNRTLHDWYVIDDPELGRVKGGVLDFLMGHPNVVSRALSQRRDEDGNLVWGSAFKRRLESAIRGERRIDCEAFADWLPTDNGFVALDRKVKDKWGRAVAKVRLAPHPHDLKIGAYLAERCANVLRELGAKDVTVGVSDSPPPNLVAGGCRFGRDPKTSVLDPDCRMHGVDNLFVADASFMPTGGSVPYTWTIYANALRVADKIAAQL